MKIEVSIAELIIIVDSLFAMDHDDLAMRLQVLYEEHLKESNHAR